MTKATETKAPGAAWNDLRRLYPDVVAHIEDYAGMEYRHVVGVSRTLAKDELATLLLHRLGIPKV